MSQNSSINSSSSFLHPPPRYCFGSRPGIFIFIAFSLTSVLLLPLYVLVLRLGYQRWRRQCSGLAAATTSHSDVFTYNMVVLELIGIMADGLYCSVILTDNVSIMLVGLTLFSLTTTGQTLFHLLTCVERYLAVVHPITYLGLRQSGGVRVRNISIACVWLFSVGAMVLIKMLDRAFSQHASACLLVFALAVISFCSLSVLCVLIRPGPGDVGGDRASVDQSKQRAFNTITAIMGALSLRFLGLLVSSETLALLPRDVSCVLVSSTAWLTLPGSLVLPLLFLHRAGKVPGCKHSAESG